VSLQTLQRSFLPPSDAINQNTAIFMPRTVEVLTSGEIWMGKTEDIHQFGKEIS
jgi:hypothetical protein